MLKEGLVIKTKESNGKVVSYKVYYQGQKNTYTASQIDRSLTAAHIADTCAKVWRQNAIEEAKLYMQEYARQHPEVQFVEAEDHSEEREMFARSDRESRVSYDEEEWARRCARQAVKMCKPQMVKRERTRSRGHGR